MMKNPDGSSVAKLTEIPNIGKAIAKNLQAIGIEDPKDLVGKNPFELFDALCSIKGKTDPCVIDVFMSAVDFMQGGKPRPWWKYTAERKRIQSRSE